MPNGGIIYFTYYFRKLKSTCHKKQENNVILLTLKAEEFAVL